MGKRIQDLHLNDSPIEHRQESLDALHQHDDSPIPDERDQPWYRFIATIDDLLASGEYDWALDSLDGIRETVTKTKRVSDGQRNAVARIEAAGERKRDGISARRYEGFRGRGR